MISLDNKTLLAMAQKQDEIAAKAYYDYQETGVTRYDTKRRNAEDLAEAFRAAANAAEEHNALQTLRAEFVWHAQKADNALAVGANRDALAAILDDIIAYASYVCGYKRREDRHADDT